MKQQKVCLVTSAAGTVGQHILASLVAEGHKVLALGEASDMFSPEVLQRRNIRVTTALPATAKSFEKHDVQFYFGDIGDISFLASIFATAEKNGIEIEYVFHLSANAMIQKSSPAAYHPDFAATANVIEVARAYWQAHKDIFKNFFYVADAKGGSKIEVIIEKNIEKEGFPATIYRDENANIIGSGYKGKTELTSLYRVVMPVGIKQIPQKQPEYDLSEKSYIKRLLYAVKRVIK